MLKQNCLPCRLFFVLRFFIILLIYFFSKIRGRAQAPRAPPLDPPLDYLYSFTNINMFYD